MLVLKEVGIALDVNDGELIYYEVDENGEVDFEAFGAIESVANKEIVSRLTSFANALKEPSDATCVVCGKGFLTKQPTLAKFCSNACSQKNKYSKNKKGNKK